MIITIDGPAGSGKSTVARMLAARLGAAYLDSGAMYRALTLAALRGGVDLDSESALAVLSGQVTIDLETGPDQAAVLLDGEDVSREIRSAEVSEKASYLAASPAVRTYMVVAQRRLGNDLGSVVSEGRDQGTVVFPNADVKFYLDATPQKRAERRLADLLGAGENISYEQVLESLNVRDGADRSRAIGPLRRPEGALSIDTTHLTLEQVVETLLARIEEMKREI